MPTPRYNEDSLKPSLASTQPTTINAVRRNPLDDDFLGDIARVPVTLILIRPGCAMHHGDRAIRTIVWQQFGDDLLQMVDPQVNRHGGAMSSQAGEVFAGGHGGLSA